MSSLYGRAMRTKERTFKTNGQEQIASQSRAKKIEEEASQINQADEAG